MDTLQSALIVNDAISRIDEVLNEKPVPESGMDHVPSDNSIILEHVSGCACRFCAAHMWGDYYSAVISVLLVASRLIKDKTVLVIVHRMRTVSGADKVVVLSNGTVAEQATPEKLMETGRIYPHMVKMQTTSQNWGI